MAALVFSLVAAAALGACGGDDDDEGQATVPAQQRAILSTIEDLQAASRRGDAARICDDIFTETLAASIRRASKHSCAAEVRETLVSPDARISVARGIRVKGSRATATVREQNGDTSRVSLVKDGDVWRIERIRPAASS
jgi:hypothetical protein